MITIFGAFVSSENICRETFLHCFGCYAYFQCIFKASVAGLKVLKVCFWYVVIIYIYIYKFTSCIVHESGKCTSILYRLATYPITSSTKSIPVKLLTKWEIDKVKDRHQILSLPILTATFLKGFGLTCIRVWIFKVLNTCSRTLDIKHKL